MSNILDAEDEVVFSEPILAQKGVRCGISFVESNEWEVKKKEKWSDAQASAMSEFLVPDAEGKGKLVKALKITVNISDDSVRTEHEDAKPRLTIEDHLNLEKYPYPDKEGNVKWLGRQKLYQLEEAFGFEPVFKAGGQVVEPHVTRTGKKVAPKIEGVSRVLNPDFYNAYFNADDTPKVDEWVGKEIYADISLENSEKFGDRNGITRYVKAPEV